MPDDFKPACGENVEYKAFARHFEHPDDDENRSAVLYVVATLSKPDSGWRFRLAEQAGEPEIWHLFEDEPAARDGDRTYFVASGSSEKPIDDVPKSIAVLDADGRTRVSVVAWD